MADNPPIIVGPFSRLADKHDPKPTAAELPKYGDGEKYDEATHPIENSGPDQSGAADRVRG